MATEEKIKPLNQPDWTIDDLYRTAWKIVKKNKLLWVFATAVGGGYSFNSNSSIDDKDIEMFNKFFNGETPNQTKELTRVLGEATSGSADIIGNLFSSVPLSFYILIGLELFLLLAISIIISLIYQSWANGALLINIQACIEGGKATIHEASEKAFKYMGDLIWLETIPMLIFFFAAFAGFAIFLAGLLLAPDSIKIVSGIGLAIYTIVVLIALYALMLTLIWAPRQVVTENKSAKQALKDSYHIVKKKKWAMLLLGVVNNLLFAFIIGVPVVIVVALVVGAIFAGSAIDGIGPFLLIAAIPLLLAFIVGINVASGVINAFKATVWSLAYKEIKGKYDRT